MPEAFALGGFLISTRALGVLGSLLIAIWLSGWVAARSGIDRHSARRLAESMVWIGLVGARLGFVARNWEAYRGAPWTALYVWQPGYSLYAGVAAGTAWAVFRLVRRSPPLRLAVARALTAGFAAGALLMGTVFLAVSLIAGQETLRRGDPVPDFTLATLNGRPVRLSSLSGRAVVLNFWATWCPPCVREMPLLDEMQKKYADLGIAIVGVNLSEPVDLVGSFVDSVEVDYPIWVDGPAGGAVTDGIRDLFSRFGGVGLPTTYFIDRGGVLRDIRVGELNRAILENRIGELLED